MPLFLNKMHTGTITLTYSEVVENHVGNQQSGVKMQSGPGVADLECAAAKLNEEYGVDARLVNLGYDETSASLGAAILVIRGLNLHSPVDFEAVKNLDWDKKYWDVRRSKVLNKRARYNLCFTDTPQEPDYETGKGRVYSFDQLPKFAGSLRQIFSNVITVDGEPMPALLNAEGNYYYEPKSNIGWHGDVERSVVAGYRMGKTMPLLYRWHNGPEILTDPLQIDLHDGDAYIMSHFATGYNWRKKQVHLRHAAGQVKV